MWTTNYVHNASSTQTALAGHFRRMKDRRIPKDILHGALIAGKRYRYRDVYKRDMKELSIDDNKWEELAIDRSKWNSYLQATLIVGEKKIPALENKRRLNKKIKNCQLRSCQHCKNDLLELNEAY